VNKVDPFLRPDIGPEWLCLRDGVPLPADGVTFVNRQRTLKATVSYVRPGQGGPKLHLSCSKRDGSRVSDEECAWVIRELLVGPRGCLEIHATPQQREAARQAAEVVLGRPVAMPDVRHFFLDAE
jgi:hypothetical protein